MGEQLDILFNAPKPKRQRKPRAPKVTAVAPSQRMCPGFSVRAGACDRGAGHEGPHGCGATTWRVSERGVVVHGDERELCAAKLMQPNGFAWLGEERLCSREVGHAGDHENDCGDTWAEGMTIAPCPSCFGARTDADGLAPCAVCEGTGRAVEEPPAARVCPTCGTALAWDADKVGETCGGLELRGWWRCAPCDTWWLASNAERRQLGAAGASEAWVLTKGGRSVDAGGARLRAEGGDAVELMRRVVVLPELEAALARIAAGAADAQAVARAALALVEVAS